METTDWNISWRHKMTRSESTKSFEAFRGLWWDSFARVHIQVKLLTAPLFHIPRLNPVMEVTLLNLSCSPSLARPFQMKAMSLQQNSRIQNLISANLLICNLRWGLRTHVNSRASRHCSLFPSFNSITWAEQMQCYAWGLCVGHCRQFDGNWVLARSGLKHDCTPALCSTGGSITRLIIKGYQI